MKDESAPHTRSDAQVPLLDAAETLFARHGFDGIGMKAIAAQAGVSQALLHYHFGTKDGLYRAVIGRRATAINSERAAHLDRVDLHAPESMRQVFEAFLAPPLGPAGGGQAFARLFSGLVGGGARDRVLIKEFYEDTAQRFVTALMQARPGATRLQAARAYSMALGSLAIALSSEDRIWRLAGRGDVVPDAPEMRGGILDHLIAHACGGFEALVTQDPDRSSRDD